MSQHDWRFPWVHHKLVSHDKVTGLSHASRSNGVVVRGQNAAAREVAGPVQLENVGADPWIEPLAGVDEENFCLCGGGDVCDHEGDVPVGPLSPFGPAIPRHRAQAVSERHLVNTAKRAGSTSDCDVTLAMHGAPKAWTAVEISLRAYALLGSGRLFGPLPFVGIGPIGP